MTILLMRDLLLNYAIEKLLFAAISHATILFLVIILDESLNLIFKPISKLIEVSMVHQLLA